MKDGKREGEKKQKRQRKEHTRKEKMSGKDE